MSAIIAACQCGSILPEVSFCEEHHTYSRNGKKLTSVTSLIRQCWPEKKVFDGAKPEVLDHARERGTRIDRYFSEYIRTGGYVQLPHDEWDEVHVGVKALRDWWKGERLDKTAAKAQVIVADNDVAGMADLVCAPTVIDIKVVHTLDPTYDIQVGGYGDLHGSITEGFLIHCKIDARELTAKVKVVPVDMKQAVTDWRAMRDVWVMAQRRLKK